ncbi:MAG: recombinase family protein [Rhodocyclaceae bacterium]|nr:MAG: recombinase family protein [Rhodocyclaceae bacterium]
MATHAYLRVSTAQQAQSGAGLDAQEDACRRAAGTLAGVYKDEGVSGKTGLDKRPALLEAIAELGKGDVLIVAKRDRLGRDPLAVAMIESAVKRKGARIASAAGEGSDGDSPTDILMRRMVDAFAEYERLVIGARTKSALQAKKARNERVGSIPYGHRLDDDGKTLIADNDERAIIAEVIQLQAEGLSLRAIAARLESAGHRPRGNGWHPQTVKNILAAA